MLNNALISSNSMAWTLHIQYHLAMLIHSMELRLRATSLFH